MPTGMDGVQDYGEIAALDDDTLVLFSNVCLSFAGYEMWILQKYINASNIEKIDNLHKTKKQNKNKT